MNEPPSQPTLSSYTVAEHASVGDQVGTFFASDSDQGQAVTFSLVASGQFELQGDRLLVAGPLNYELNNMSSLVVQVKDNGTPMQTVTAQFTITIQDENDAPTAVHLSTVEIPEAGPDSVTFVGTVIGSLTTDDEDKDDTHAYTRGGLFSSCFSVVGSDLTVGDASCFDHETNPTLSLTIVSRDSSGLTVQQTFSVVVTDVNEPPSGITLSSSSVQEHVAINTVVGTLTVVDPDQADSHQLSLVTSDSLFNVQGRPTNLMFCHYIYIWQKNINYIDNS